MVTGIGAPLTSDVVRSVLRTHPDVADQFHRAYAASWQVVDPVLLELCRLRAATLLGCAAELAERTPEAVDGGLDEATVKELAQWPTSPRFGPRERACLELCEQFVIDVAGTTDEQAAAVAVHLGAAGLRDLTAGLLVVEQRQRLRLAWQALAVPGAA